LTWAGCCVSSLGLGGVSGFFFFFCVFGFWGGVGCRGGVCFLVVLVSVFFGLCVVFLGCFGLCWVGWNFLPKFFGLSLEAQFLSVARPG